MFSLLLPYPAALIKEKETRTLIISDPHIGWETQLQEKGIHVPNQTNKILTKLNTLLLKYKPYALVILGDVKYSVFSSKLIELNDIPEFFQKISRHVEEISVVRGNHDANLEPLLPANVKLLPATGGVFGDVGVFHGHKWPSPLVLGCKTLVMGHLHPVVLFKDPLGCKMTKRVWMRVELDSEEFSRTLLQKFNIKIKGSVQETLREQFKVDLRASELYIAPSFNDFLGGSPINGSRIRKGSSSDGLIGPILRSDVVHVDGSEIYLLDGTYLGNLNHLRRL